MKNILSRNIIALVIAFFAVVTVSAQGLKDMVINEVLVKNENSMVDDHGHRVGWIELRNTGYTNVNLASSVLEVTNNDGSIVRYTVPKYDTRTTVSPQGFVVFFADGDATKGTFYTNFTLDNCKSIALQSGGTEPKVVSSVEISSTSAKDDVSMGYVSKVVGEEPEWTALKTTSPGATNETLVVESRSEMFEREDPSGITMALTAMSVVFSALLVLFLVFKQVGIILVSFANRKERKAKGEPAPVTPKSKAQLMKDEINGEVITAIAVALRQYENDLHDIESDVVTINRVARMYSPWSSKIYGVNNVPNKR